MAIKYSRRYSSEVSGSLVNTNSQVEQAYTCDRGTETIRVDDELLTSLDVAQERAEAIFLAQSYKEKSLTIVTYHVDSMKIGHIIEVNGTLYKVTSIEDSVEGVKAYMTITIKRWE